MSRIGTLTKRPSSDRSTSGSSSSGNSVGASSTDERRNGDNLTYDDWVAKQVSNGYPEWFVRWAFPREHYEGTDDYQGLKNFGSFAATLAGIFKGIPALIGKFKNSSQSSSDSTNDALLSSLYGDAYTPKSGGLFGNISSGLKDLFSGMSSQIGSGLLGIGSELGSSILNYQNQERLIDKQNAYNTPANQMQRFADAGLNPNLIYGLGSNGNQPASGSIAPVDFDSAQRENRMAQMQIATQTKLAEAEIADKMADVNLKNTQSGNVSVQTAYQQMVNNNYLHQLQVELDEILARTDNLREEKRKIQAEADTAETRSRIADIEKEIASNEKKISDKKAEYAEATAFTEMLGNIFGINLGFGLNYGRSRVIR